LSALAECGREAFERARADKGGNGGALGRVGGDGEFGAALGDVAEVEGERKGMERDSFLDAGVFSPHPIRLRCFAASAGIDLPSREVGFWFNGEGRLTHQTGNVDSRMGYGGKTHIPLDLQQFLNKASIVRGSRRSYVRMRQFMDRFLG